ncbi:SusC/RagA family TonB-linked outer membrane protein [Pedobacter sp. MW01-1-1]|uniref:SusC/RagA family TonB-linked outer membrane protein n=1 Tax=Pedobacter sp. MW01-1-1 TaxID=3383027 RepID=UPI003FEDA6F1
MKLTFLLLITLFIQISQASLAQNVSVSANKGQLTNLLKEIRVQSGYNFVYAESALKNANPVTVNLKAVPLEIALKEIFKNQPLSYTIEKKTIIIKEAEPSFIERQIDRFFKTTVKGVVVDKKGEVIPNATIMIKGSMVGVSASSEGKFSIDIPENLAGKAVLVVSLMGYKTKEIEVGNQTDIKVVLDENVSDLKDVTVVAYGERTKEKLINSVVSVKADQIKDMPAANLENLLQGQMAGVAVVNRSGSPGGTGSIVNIRGQNSLMVTGPSGALINNGAPLYVVDGVPIISDNNTKDGVSGLADIDPSTIESAEVLKDASAAALYGSRANNGVILITTKKGKTGKAEIVANVSMGFNILPKTPVQTLGKAERDMAMLFAQNATLAYYNTPTASYVVPGSYQQAWGTQGTYDYFWGNGVAMGGYQPAIQDSLNSYYNNSSNWWKYFFQTGKTLNTNLSISGGTDLSKYNIAFGHYNEEGIMVGSAFSRYNLTANMNFTPRKNLVISSNNYLAYTNRGKGQNSNNGSATMVGSPKASSTMLSLDNPIALAQSERIAATEEKNNTYRLRSGLNVALTPVKGLKISSAPAIDFSEVSRNVAAPNYIDQQYGLAKSENFTTRRIVLNWENLATYNTTIASNHNVEVLLGQGMTKQINETLYGMGRGMASNDIHYVPLLPVNDATQIVNGTTVVTRNFSSTFSETMLLSYFTRVAYDYKSKYLAEFSIRADGSSTFGEGKRWGKFPAAALGWNFSKESFLENAWWLSAGKLRASWGKTGLQFGDPYLAQGTVSDAHSTGFLGQAGLAPDIVSYNNLAWEEDTQYGVGLDLDLFDFRLKINADYYHKYNKGQIYNAPFPGNVYYLPSTWRNTFSSSNQGYELNVQYDVLRGKAFNWRTRLNMARNTNRFEESYNGMDVANFILGRPLMGFNVYIQEGFVNNSNEIPRFYNPNGSVQYLNAPDNFHPVQVGMKKILDLNADGRINDLDKAYVGSPIPQVAGGWINDFSWKNFQLNVLFNFVISQDMINALPYSSYIDTNAPTPKLIFYDYANINYWNAAGAAAAGSSYSPMFPSPNLGYSPQSDPMISSNIENVNYIRLKKLSLSYSFNKNLVKKIGLSSARVFGTAENLFLITNYSGLDPEAVPYNGVDNLDNYPLARTYTIGCAVNF